MHGTLRANCSLLNKGLPKIATGVTREIFGKEETQTSEQ